ncbi:MAG: GntR family transcriptional regulator [Lachnospiraceae bacterium]|nr:GntR family transcriptional regulator [Lachnospiraceae bacterium]
MEANTVLTENAYNYILDEILSGRIKPGERIREDEIAAKMGTSRTPVREAVNQLSQNGFIKYVKRKGLYCVQFDHEELESLLELREMLEEFSYIQCSRVGTKEEIEKLHSIVHKFVSLTSTEKESCHVKCDVLFHETAAEITKNERLIKYIREIETLLLIVRRNLKASERMEDVIDISWKHHDQIVDAIENKDVEKIKKLNREHIEMMRRTQLETE